MLENKDVNSKGQKPQGQLGHFHFLGFSAKQRGKNIFSGLHSFILVWLRGDKGDML